MQYIISGVQNMSQNHEIFSKTRVHKVNEKLRKTDRHEIFSVAFVASPFT